MTNDLVGTKPQAFLILLGCAVFICLCFVSPSEAKSDLGVVRPVIACEDLSAVNLEKIGGEGSKITKAIETTSDGIPVCAVYGQLSPSISFQALLPTETWTQRYLQVGCGGLCGNIMLLSGASSGCPLLTGGEFVMAATDMGHSGNSIEWANDPQKQIDFAYRAQHVTSLAVKALIKGFYGQEQAFAYFNGCSDGGREALMEAERFPDDFNGVIAGAPAMLFTVQNTLYHGWQAVSNTGTDGKIILTSDRLPILHKAVVDACDADDGLKDGLISQPALCNFDLASITCQDGVSDTSACLTATEAAVARKFYDGPRDAKTGAPLTAGQPLYGSELEWQGVYVSDRDTDSLMSTGAALPVWGNLAFEEKDPDIQLSDLSFTEEKLAALRKTHPFFDATNADLNSYKDKGGKLILWHGLADPHISPANTLSLHNAMRDFMGTEAVDMFERLYFLPGVGHCSGGQGPSNIDLLSAIVDWVEDGQAPDAILTSSTAEASSFGQPDFDDGGEKHRRPEKLDLGVAKLPDMSRPVYPYPYTAKFNGSGDYTDSANWIKGNAAEIIKVREWPGKDMFGAYQFFD
ncbi:tannase/feruloyl esterase family alpha/beta hydrolase [uncultured Cohaesibacter sp.]|uniref:tannase/feruloyl esterase family alpha/beta hydrolase n=1 Tax=uncultured Cohaesibacter sp. TaxID=1002546 RepID=UPI0029C7AF65|nr:tannase/feruloyl esterase family alpha/beta hydrolase [uncultured Cohaesibacter sp.]